MTTLPPAPRPHAGTAALLLCLALANLAAWLWAWAVFAGHPALLATALLAWVFGLRHAVDADHIAAIDNVVRGQAQRGADGRTVGLWFSLGHSSVVMLACVGIAATAAMGRQLEGVRALGGPVGTAVSAGFLLLIAAANTAILAATWRRFRAVRAGAPDAAPADPGPAGWLARLARPLFRLIRRNWHMYPLGFLFGLGFDTATEIGLLGLSAGAAAQGVGAGLSPWAALVFPALFTAGMALVDTADSVLMTGAYGWALANPLRKLWYNLTITAASVAVAVLIGGLEALGLLAERLHLEGAFWRVVAALGDDMETVGFAVIAIFALCWAVSAALYHSRLGSGVRGQKSGVG